MKRVLIVGMVVLAGAAACGKSKEEKAAEQTAAAAQQMAEGAQKMAEAAQGGAAQGVAQMMQGMAQMGQAANNGQPVQVVDYEKLKELIPDVGGWEKSNVKGSQSGMGGFSVSKAEADYKKGDAHIDLEITDSSFNPLLTAAFSMFGLNYSERSDEGYKKGTKVGGFPAYEEWNKDSKHAELNVLVGGRFIVHANGSDVDNAEAVQAVVNAINLQKLAALK